MNSARKEQVKCCCYVKTVEPRKQYEMSEEMERVNKDARKFDAIAKHVILFQTIITVTNCYYWRWAEVRQI